MAVHPLDEIGDLGQRHAFLEQMDNEGFQCVIRPLVRRYCLMVKHAIAIPRYGQLELAELRTECPVIRAIT